MFSNFSWLLKDHLKFIIFEFFCQGQNNCLHVTIICSINSTVQNPRTLVMDLTNIHNCLPIIVQAAKINILDPQKLAKNCLSDVVKCH